jgi:beta-exotoxin I transport system permease protein
MSATTLLVRAEVAQRRRMLAALAAGTFVFELAIAGTYQAFGGANLAESFGVRLPNFFSAFAGERNTNIFSPRNYVGLAYVHPLFLVLTLTVAIAIGTGSVAGDIESGRVEMLYTRPLRRTAVLDARLRLWAVMQGMVVVSGAVGSYIGLRIAPDLHGVGVPGLARLLVQYIPLVTFVGALSFAASAASRTRGQALGVAVGAIALGYLVNFLGLLWHPFAFAQRLTPFGYYLPASAVARVNWNDVAVLLAAAVCLLVFARSVLARRDLI